MPLLGKFINPVGDENGYPSPLNGFISVPVFLKLTPATVGMFSSMDRQLVGYQTETGRPAMTASNPVELLDISYWLQLNASTTMFEVNGYLCHVNLLMKKDVVDAGHPYPYFELDFIVEGKEGPVVFDVDMPPEKGYIAKPLYFQIHTRENRLNANYHSAKQKQD